MKKTKIVATLGPATNSIEQIKQLLDEGVDVFRLNLSHGTHDSHEETYEKIRSVSDKVAIMLDTKGPEVRIGEIKPGTVLEGGSSIEITSQEVKGDNNMISVNYEGLIERLETGDNVLIDDGKVMLEVVSVGKNVECEVVHGGKIETGKGVNVPGKDIGLQSPTDKDVKDIEFGLEKGFDFIALSFVKDAEDIKRVRKLTQGYEEQPDIISKIEHLDAVENYENILEVSDGIMVARGDLGVEANAAEVPLLQKEQVRKANTAAKPVIIATQMLESMTENPIATRAEASDVANAVIDGADAVMLSGETAVGKYPVRTVEFMSEIIKQTEEAHRDKVHHTVKTRSDTPTQVISKSAWQASRDLSTNYILAHTTSGSTARNIAKYRPETSVIGISHNLDSVRKLNVVWGVEPIHIQEPESVNDMIHNSVSKLFQINRIEADDQLIMSAGVPSGVSGNTNMLQIRKAGEVLDQDL